MSALNILCAGDLHLGRRASRLPAYMSDQEAHQFSAVQGWRELVRLALNLKVDTVLLAGDLIDRANRYFEAFGPLEQGIRSLTQAGIPVMAVAGNHDFDVLPRFASHFPPDQFRLLGTGGRWERHTIRKPGLPELHVDGWSFPRRHVADNPLHAYNLSPPDSGVVIGLLHADLDQGQSSFAPVSWAELVSKVPAFWLLGHWHTPVLRHHNGGPKLLYPGSLTALTPNETGVHGPWLLQLSHNGKITLQQIPLSPVRYEPVTVHLDGCLTLTDVEDRIAAGVLECLHHCVQEQSETLKLLITRIQLRGRTPTHRFLERHLSEVIANLEPQVGMARAIIDAFFVSTRPQWDLKQVSREPGPPGVLARMLLDLQHVTHPVTEKLLKDARLQVERLRRLHYYREVSVTEEEISQQVLLEQLERVGLLLLDELLAQKEQVS